MFSTRISNLSFLQKTWPTLKALSAIIILQQGLKYHQQSQGLFRTLQKTINTPSLSRRLWVWVSGTLSIIAHFLPWFIARKEYQRRQTSNLLEKNWIKDHFQFAILQCSGKPKYPLSERQLTFEMKSQLLESLLSQQIQDRTRMFLEKPGFSTKKMVLN